MGKVLTVCMPDIGEGVVEGEIIQWLKQPQELVAQDEPVVIVMTDKATVELPAPAPGKLLKQYYQLGESAVKDQPLYDLEISSEVKVGPATTPEQPRQVEKAIPKAIQSGTESKSPSKVLASPTVRKFAKKMGLDIQQIEGSGPEGRILQEDLLRSDEVRKPASDKGTPPLRLPGDQETPLIGIRSLMAKRMTESKEKIPHFSYFEQVDATRLVQLRHAFKEEARKQGIAVTYMPFIIKALSLTLNRFPIVNSSLDAENELILTHQPHNIGIAISTPNGLIVPVLKQVQKMKLVELILAYDDLIERALHNKLDSHEMKEGTITITNFGVIAGGGVWATPIINYPQAAILGLGRIHKGTVVRHGEIVIRDLLNLSWSFDHRLIDGDLAVNFSHFLSTIISNPASLL